MIDAQRLLEQFLGAKSAGGSTQPPGQRQTDLASLARNAGLSGAAGGAIAGGLAALLLSNKKARKLAGSAVKLGGMAALGGLAYKAWRDWQASQGAGGQATPMTLPEASTEAQDTVFLPAPASQRTALSMTLMRAMIAAAKADGHIDAAEQQHIFGQLDALSLGTEEKAFVMDELRRPLDIDAVVAGATTPEVAAEIYLASRLTIDPDHPAEKAYLAMLAGRLDLDIGLIAELDRQADSVT